MTLLARALIVLAVSRATLERHGTTRTIKRLAGGRPIRSEPVDVLHAVRRAGRIVGGACLPQSVALAALLQRAGRSPVLILGCSRTADGSWTAHAWVEVGDDILEPVKGGRHAKLARLDACGGWLPAAPS